MKQIILISQCVTILLAVFETLVVFKNMRKKVHYHLFINCMALLLYSSSTMLMLFTETKEAFYIPFMLSWTGKVGVVISTLLFSVSLCGYVLPRIVTFLEGIFVILTYIIIVTSSKTGLFFKDFRITKESGLNLLQYTKGPWYILWLFTVFMVILTCMIMLIKVISKEKNPQKIKLYKTIMFAPVIELIIGLPALLPIGRYYDFNQLGFSICAIIMLRAIFRNNLLDAETMAKEYIIDELSSGVVAMDSKENVAYYNKKALQIFPQIENEEKKVIERIKKSIETSEPLIVQERIYNFEERKLVHGANDEGKMYIMTDSTRHYQHLKELEREKQSADSANRAKSEFLASMSHEIRTPINAVLGMDEMILRESNESKIREYAMDIQTAGQTLLTIINDILDLNKIEAGKMEIVPVEYDVSKMIYDISNMIKIRTKDKNLTFNVSVAPDIPTKLYGDDVRIRQILMNLLTNAVKYTPSGEVSFRVKLHRMVYSTHGDQVILRFEVEDTGIGIKPEDMDKLFSKFERIEVERNRNIEGTGLGLSISMKLLSLMNSEMNVESEYGKGSVFSFELRQKIADSTLIGNYEEKKESIISKQHIGSEGGDLPEADVLVVDDNHLNLKVFRLMMEKTPLKITEANNGYTAVELATSQKFDIIFMDHMMPGMDGVEAMNRIKDVKDGPCADTPIIVLTANAVSGTKEQYLKDGFDGYLSKPIDSSRLFEEIRKLL